MAKLNFKLFNVKLINPNITRDKITSGFGWRIHPITHKRQFHNGVDIALSHNTPLYAVSNCRIEWNWHHLGGLQIIQYFRIDHLKIRVGYAHNDWVEKEKQFVEKRELIAKVGRTGRATGYHLHLTIAVWERDGWVFLDPLEVLEWNG